MGTNQAVSAGVGGGCAFDMTMPTGTSNLLTDSSAYLQRLAAGIAHDFNNVLTGIIWRAEALLDSRPPEDPLFEDLKGIHQDATKAAGLARQLVARARGAHVQRRLLAPNALLVELLPGLQHRLGGLVDLCTWSQRGLWLVRTDRLALEQALVNLAINARDAMPCGGRLAIALRNVPEREVRALECIGLQAGDYVEIEVADTGVGIAPETLAHIFEPFFTTKGPDKGNGLGLDNVRRFFTEAGGAVAVDSMVGAGTSFRCYLPRAWG